MRIVIADNNFCHVAPHRFKARKFDRLARAAANNTTTPEAFALRRPAKSCDNCAPDSRTGARCENCEASRTLKGEEVNAWWDEGFYLSAGVEYTPLRVFQKPPLLE